MEQKPETKFLYLSLLWHLLMFQEMSNGINKLGFKNVFDMLIRKARLTMLLQAGKSYFYIYNFNFQKI